MNDSVLITDDKWNNIRSNYTETEKQLLRRAFNGSCICPRGTFINLNLLNTDLRTKLTNDLKEK